MRTLPLALALALLALLAPAAAAQAACPTPVPLAELTPGTRAVGLTVVRGTEPVRFDVEVLGVLTDGLAPGRDVIVVDTSGPAIDDAGGVWNGMSGSPVYLGEPAAGRLIGAVAYGFSAGPSSIAGLTPAEDLLELLRDGATTPRDGTVEPASITLQGAVRARAAERDPDVGLASSGLRPLPTPLAVSGLARRDPAEIQRAADRAGLPVLVTPGGGAGDSGPAVPPVPGGNFAAVLSVGDVTSAAVGTTAVVCEDRAVGLAHEFTASGPTLLAAHTADAVAVVDDPEDGPFKLANIGAAFGALDADRYAGVRARLGSPPPTIPVTSEVTAAERGVTRPGRSGVVRAADVPLSAALHLVGNIDATIDRVGGGSATLDVRVTGRAGDGTPFAYERSNVFASDDDIANEVAFTENFAALSALQNVEGLTFDAVAYTARVAPGAGRYRVSEVLVGVGGAAPAPVSGAPVLVPAGGVLDVRVVLDGGPTVDLAVQVPATSAGGTLVVSGAGTAQPAEPAVPVPDQPAAPPGSVGELVAALEARPTNAELAVEFQPYEADLPAPRLRDAEVLDAVVSGSVAVPVVTAPPDYELTEILGADRVATAAALSADSFVAADTVVLARADGHADALAAAPLAAGLGGPLLLTDPGALRPEVADEVARLGAREAVLLGGEEALGGEVAATLAEAGVTVRRVAGENRYATARAIAAEVGGSQAYVASSWPDALSVSALAAAQRRPILLVETGTVPAATRRALEDLGIDDVTVVGGETAVTPGVFAAMGERMAVRRVAGADRYATSLEVAKLAVATGARLEHLTLATGRTFPDALAAGPAVAAGGGVLLLLDGEAPAGSPDTYAYLEQVRDAVDEVRLLGGSAAISPDVRAALTAALAAAAPVPDVAVGPVDPGLERP